MVPYDHLVTIVTRIVAMLRPSKKALLIVEIFVCFGPVIPLLILGLLVAPVQIQVGIAQSPNWVDAVVPLGQVMCGLIGIAALAYVVSKLFEGHGSISRPTLVCIGTALGALAVAPILLASSLGWKLVGLLPLAASLHILFLARRMLFSSWRDATAKAVLAIAIVLPLGTIPMLDPARTSGNALREKKEFWDQRAPERYEFTVQLSGFPSGWRKSREVLEPKRIKVASGEVVSVSYVWDLGEHHKAGDSAPMDSLWTIERAFSELLAAEQDGWIVHARLNETWGYIESAHVEPREEETLSGWALEVRDFQVEAPAIDARRAQRRR